MENIIDFCNNLNGIVSYSKHDTEDDIIIELNNEMSDEDRKVTYIEISLPSKETSAMIEIVNDYIDYVGFRLKSNGVEGNISMIKDEVLDNIYAVVKHGFNYFQKKGALNF